MPKSSFTGGYSFLNDPRASTFSNELKYVDTIITPAVISSGGTWTKISMPPQGVTSVTRLADRCRILKVDHLSYFYATAQSDITRFIIIQVKGVQTAPPATTDLLVSASPISQYAYNARDLYEVIYDVTFSQSLTGDTIIGTHRMSHVPKIGSMKFIPGSTNVYNGQLYFMAISINNGNITNSHQFRVWFEDAN